MQREFSMGSGIALVMVAGLLVSLKSPAENPEDVPGGNTGANWPAISPNAEAAARKGVKPVSPTACKAAARKVESWLRTATTEYPLALIDDEELELTCRDLDAAAIESLLTSPGTGWCPMICKDWNEELINQGPTDNAARDQIHACLLKHFGRLDPARAIALSKQAGEPAPNEEPPQVVLLKAEIYRGLAAEDGAAAFQALCEEHNAKLRRMAAEEVMKQWTLQDPAKAWEGLVQGNEMTPGWSLSLKDYFGALRPNTDWEQLRVQVEAYEGGEENRHCFEDDVTLDAAFAEAWMKNNPQGTLAWYDSRAKPFKRGNLGTLLAYKEGRTEEGLLLAKLVGGWLSKDPTVEPWLKSWEPKRASADEVFSLIAGDESYPEETRERARHLIRDPDWLKKRAEREKPELPNAVEVKEVRIELETGE